MYNIIEITSANYKKYLDIDSIAISFAQAGAMGEKGGIYIIASDNILYHCNFTNNITLNEVFELFPFIKNCRFNPIKSTAPEGWKIIYMGFGNFLIIKDSIKNMFLKRVKEMQPHELYKNWKDIVLQLS